MLQERRTMTNAWRKYTGTKWRTDIDVRDFIQHNYTPYEGNEDFLEGPTSATTYLWNKIQDLQKEERKKGGVLDCETKIISSLTAYGPGYIDSDLERIVGLQTDKPLKRALMPQGGIRMAEEAAKSYGYEVDPKVHEIFTNNQFGRSHDPLWVGLA